MVLRLTPAMQRVTTRKEHKNVTRPLPVHRSTTDQPTAPCQKFRPTQTLLSKTHLTWAKPEQVSWRDLSVPGTCWDRKNRGGRRHPQSWTRIALHTTTSAWYVPRNCGPKRPSYRQRKQQHKVNRWNSSVEAKRNSSRQKPSAPNV